MTFTAEEEGEAERTDFCESCHKPSQAFRGGLWLFVGSAYVFWKLLAGIRGTLTDGILRESSVIQQWCQSKRPASNTCSEPLLWWSFQSWKLWKTTEAQIRCFFSSFFFFFIYLFFHLFISLTDKGQMVIQSLLEFQNRPPSFHSTPPPRPPLPSPPPRPSRGQARVPVMEQIHQDTF